MGCASSNPIVQGGKQLVETAKDSVTEAVNKGEHVLHNAGEAAKEGMEHVKEAVGTAVTSAEAGIESMVEKVGDSFSSSKKEAGNLAEEAKTKADDETNTAITTTTETISDAETVVASEADNAKDFMVKTRTAVLKAKMDDVNLKNEFGEVVTTEDDEEDEEIGKKGSMANETSLQLEDLEDAAPLGDIVQSNYKCMKKKAQDLMAGSALPPAIESETQVAKEEPAPTFWEAAADAIIQQRSRHPFRFDAERPDDDENADEEEQEGYALRHHLHHDRHRGTSPTVTAAGDPEDDLTVGVDAAKPFRPAFEGELFEKEHIRPPEIIINSENLSIKSYKSEI